SEEKVYWYNAAEIFVYPSLYEGFGLPPLEAMACGTPVIASNAASLPEVVGDAGILIDAQDTNALAEALDFLLDHPEEREALKEKGLRRSREFSWEKTARETSELYRRVIYRRR
ncbi:MAG TPA: glycosyltransferase family 1 protein, partial [Chloroflexi bacterium]|nr:glycosyltransferase family 1 protein [Chloroflexota bacterium]